MPFADGRPAPIDRRHAQAVMGGQFVGPDAVELHLGVRYAPEQLRQLEALSFSEDTLRACRPDHVLVAGYPVDLLDLRTRCPSLVLPKRPAWYDGEACAQAAVGLGWYLVRRDVLPGSLDRTYAEQRALLAADEAVPTMAELGYVMLLRYLTAGERLLPATYARCRDRVGEHSLAMLGEFTSWLVPDHELAGIRDPRIGLASMRLPTPPAGGG